MDVSDVSESELIALFAPSLPVGAATLVGPGDDAAVVAARGSFVVSTDLLVQDRHFRLGWGSAEDLGYRAAMQNLADIAAMGALPTAMVIGLVLPHDTQVEWVLGLARGLAEAVGPFDAGVVGGDLSSGDAIVVAVTVHGDLAGGRAVLRSGARAADVVAHAGALGMAAAGLAALEAGEASRWPEHVRAFLRPECPVRLGRSARDAGATAMLDVSDGLLRDADRLAGSSGVRLDLDPDLLDRAELRPIGAALDVDPLEWALTGGEDHGLLATFPAHVELPAAFRPVGVVEEGAGLRLAGRPVSRDLGWDHFRRN